MLLSLSGRFGDLEIRMTDSKNPPKLLISETPSIESNISM